MIESTVSQHLAELTSADDVDRLFDDRSFPDVSGSVVTFVFRGDADRVELRNWIYGLPSNFPMKQVEGTDLWHCSMDFPEESRIEYKFEVSRNGQTEWILDPVNPKIAHDPFGGNSVVHCPGYIEPERYMRNLRPRKAVLKF